MNRSLSKWWLTFQRRHSTNRLVAARRHRGRSTYRPRSEELENRQLLSAANLFGSALPIDINSGQSVAGNLRTTPSIYSFEVKEDGRLITEALLTGGASRLTLLSANGTVLMQSDGQSPTNPNDLIDLHLTGSTTGTTYYLEVQALGAAGGAFTLQTSFVTATPPFRTLAVGNTSWGHAFDVNHDGAPDLVVANFSSSNVSVLLSRGDGTFAPQATYDVGGAPNDVLAVDLRGNGVPDLVAANFDGSLEILQGHGDGTFGPATRIVLGVNPSALATGDFNGDGHMDVAVSDFGAGNVAVLYGQGDDTFSAPNYFEVGSGPYELIAADFNKDGQVDLAVANYNSDSVSFLMGNANGAFEAQRSFAVGQGPYGLVAGDFTGTGQIDLATANYTSNDVSVLLYNGNSSFAAAISLPSGLNPYGVVAADFNNDGHMDLVATNFSAGTLSIFTGRGQGAFNPATTLNVGSTPAFIVAADFNHDGRIDLAHGDYTGHVSIALGRGDGTFQTLLPTAAGAAIQSITTADYNGDGYLDLATVNYSTGDVQIQLGRNDGTFQDGGRYASGSDAVGIASGDFNHDGIIDLVVTNYSTGNISVFMGVGDGTFGAPTFFATGSLPNAVVTGDFNGDGNVDLAVADLGANTVSILVGHGDGTFAAPLDFAVNNGPYALVTGDFNGDGILDLATANIDDSSATVLFGRGDGSFGQAIQLSAGAAPDAIVAADFNDDGILDLAVANLASTNVSVFLGQPNSQGKPGGTFGPQAVFAAGSGPSALAVADFNRDGTLDLAVTDSNTDNLIVLFGQGNGTFQASGQVAVGAYPLGIVIGDFNSDGLPDLAAANSNSSDVSLLLGRGTGTFQSAKQTAIAGGPVAIASNDFNTDGHLDLVTANPLTRSIDVSLSNGDGTFQTPQTIHVGGHPNAVTTGDFNRDGRPDIAVADFLTDTVSILLGTGDGTFQSPLSLHVGSDPDALATGDFNRDGITDLAVANFGDGTVSILLGETDGYFKAAQQIKVGKGPVALAVGDVNGDGTTELIVANSLSRSISVLEGLGDGTFQVIVTVPLGMAPGAVVAGAFNSDGNLDIAVANQAGNTVSVLLGKGNGSFMAAVKFVTGGGPIALVSGDFNGDGHLDLATANNNSNDVTLLLGHGDGAFQSQAPFSVGAYPFALVASDFNNDGRLDLATANGLGVALSVGLGFGNSTFTEPGASFPAVQSRPIVADLNGDGIPDVTVLESDGKILFRPGKLGGAFGAPVIVNPGPAGDARDISVGSGQGGSYVAAVNSRSGSFSLYVFFGGQFQRLPTLQSTESIPSYIRVGDVNGDGLDDLVMSLADSKQILVYLQEPREDFSNRQPDYQFEVGIAISDLSIADMNGDGRPDIVVTDQSAGAIHVFLNSITNPFASQLLFRTGTGLVQVDAKSRLGSFDSPMAMVVGPFNADAFPDIAVVNTGANRVDILLGDGHGGVYNPAPGLCLVTGQDPVAIVTADFNGDGRLDLAVLNKGSDDLSIFLGKGDGSFTKQTTTGPDGQKVRISAGNSPTGLTAADINMDGKLDLLIGNVQGDVLTVLGNGDGSFRAYQRIDPYVGLALTDPNSVDGPGFAFVSASLDQVTYQDSQAGATFQQGRQDGVLAPSAVKFADLNHDSFDDLIVANGGGNNVLVYLGLGNDRFGSAYQFFVGTNPEGMTVNDLNSDGIPDLVVANAGSNDVSVLFGQGQGADWTFTPGPRLQAGRGPVTTAVRDLNGDGVPDILVANSESNDVYLLQGIGRGFFNDANPRIYQTGTDPEQLFIGNFDGHSGLDFVTVNAGSNDLTFFSNLGSGRAVKIEGADPVAAVAGDFNHDGVSDLIVADSDGLFTLFAGSTNGPQAGNALLVPGLANIADMAIGSTKGDAVNLYATVDGIEAAYLVTFVLDQSSSSLDQSSSSLETFVTGGSQELLAHTASAEVQFVESGTLQEAEYSSLSDSPLGIVATLTLGSEADGPVVSANTPSPTRNADEEAGLVAETDDGQSDLSRESLIAGATELPIMLHLEDTEGFEAPTVVVPFPSPFEWYDSSGQAPFEADQQRIIDEISRWNAGRMGNLPTIFATEETGARIENKLSPVSVSELDSNFSTDTPVYDLSFIDDVSAQRLLDQRALESTLQNAKCGGLFSLAFSFGFLFLVQEQPRKRRRGNPTSRTK